MGNTSSSKEPRIENPTVDGGFLNPQQGNVYSGPQDWDPRAVGKLIIDRKLAPFYQGLADYSLDWDDANLHRVINGEQPGPQAKRASVSAGTSSASAITQRARAQTSSGNYRTATQGAYSFEYLLYRKAVECPICFLYYPPNINNTRCCNQPICTECFVQIKRADITTLEQQSEPACCPYCVQSHFGIYYDAPVTFRTGLGAREHPPPIQSTTDLPADSSALSTSPPTSPDPITPNTPPPPRRKSFAHNDPKVVTSDDIRPDWEQRVQKIRQEQIRRAAAAASHRRIIVRTIGPNGQTITTTLRPGGRRAAAAAAAAAAWAAQHPEQNQGQNQNQDGSNTGDRTDGRGLGLRSVGQDLEDLMVMEAIRLSLLEEEERTRRERQNIGESQASPDGPTESVSRITHVNESPLPALPSPLEPSSSSSPSTREVTAEADDGAWTDTSEESSDPVRQTSRSEQSRSEQPRSSEHPTPP